MQYTFDLVEKPWIPCLMLDGTAMELSLSKLFAKAKEIREINDPSPLVTISLYRLLLAILHRNFGPRNYSEWVSIWGNGNGVWDLERLDGYLKKWHDQGHFDLFHSEQPFYQTGQFIAKKISPISRLRHELASGNNPTLFNHSFENDNIPFTAAEAARALVTHQAFAIGGGRSDTGYTSNAPLIGKAVVLLRGDNLFQTLMLNLIRYDGVDNPFQSGPNDRTAWEKESPVSTKERKPDGYLDYLTWQSRTIRLIPEGLPENPVVRGLYYAQGEALNAEGYPDPETPYKMSEKYGWRSVKFNIKRAFWRDSTAIFRLSDGNEEKKSKPPKVIEWVSGLANRGKISNAYKSRIDVYGLCNDKTNQAKVHSWRHEQMPLPIKYLEEPELINILDEEIQRAEEISTTLRDALYILALYLVDPFLDEKENSKPDKKAVQRMLDSFNAESLYWSALELPFYQLLEDLPVNAVEARHKWGDILTTAILNAFNTTAFGLETKPKFMKATIHARKNLNIKLAKVFLVKEE
jgi:CRISPR system Cascade subunit CasA